MIGIYKYTNKINGKSYIGQSINIERRQYSHKSAAYNVNANDYNSQFHQAIRKYGLENFDYEIIVELTQDEYTKDTLNSLEKFFIKYYNSYNDGYNAHIPFRTVYQEYQNKISKRGLQKIWWFDTWKNIYPEYHTEENKYWHSHQAKSNPPEVAANNKRSFTKEEVIQMRQDYVNGMTPK